MGLCREIYQEGVRIPPVKLMSRGALNRDVLAMLLNNVRTPDEREGDRGEHDERLRDAPELHEEQSEHRDDDDRHDPSEAALTGGQ